MLLGPLRQGGECDLVAAVENVPFRTAAIMLQGWFGIEPDSPPASSSSPKAAEGTEKGKPLPTSVGTVTTAPMVGMP